MNFACLGAAISCEVLHDHLPRYHLEAVRYTSQADCQMLSYYMELGLNGLRRNRWLTALMVLAIAVGIGASMTALTVLHVLSGDPIPARSGILFYPQVDPRDMLSYRPDEEPPAQLSWIDGVNLLQAHRAERQALMTGGSVAVQPDGTAVAPFFELARYTTPDFFIMFDVPMLYGRSWSEQDEERGLRVVVISTALNQRLFGGKDSVGQSLRLSGTYFRIIGVMGDWRPNPYFLDLNRRTYNQSEGVYTPLQTSQQLGLIHDGSVECWGNGGGGARVNHQAPCVWLQFWVQLGSPAKVAAYTEFLRQYSAQQHALGRFQRPPNIRLRNVLQCLDYNDVVPDDVRLQTWLAFGFLLVCLFNTTGLMLAKFMRRAGELSVRRALGASRLALFAQLLVEAGIVGIAGGIAGVLLALLGLWLVRQLPAQYASLACLSGPMLLLTLALAVASSLLAALLPAWRTCQLPPAIHLRSQ